MIDTYQVFVETEDKYIFVLITSLPKRSEELINWIYDYIETEIQLLSGKSDTVNEFHCNIQIKNLDDDTELYYSDKSKMPIYDAFQIAKCNYALGSSPYEAIRLHSLDYTGYIRYLNNAIDLGFNFRIDTEALHTITNYIAKVDQISHALIQHSSYDLSLFTIGYIPVPCIRDFQSIDIKHNLKVGFLLYHLYNVKIKKKTVEFEKIQNIKEQIPEVIDTAVKKIIKWRVDYIETLDHLFSDKILEYVDITERLEIKYSRVEIIDEHAERNNFVELLLDMKYIFDMEGDLLSFLVKLQLHGLIVDNPDILIDKLVDKLMHKLQ